MRVTPADQGRPGPGYASSILLFVALTTVFLVGLELWLGRWAWPVDPAWYRITYEGEQVLFGCQDFRPVAFSASPARARIIVLGGSSAFGFPDRPVGDAPLTSASHGVAGALQTALDRGWPGAFEVVNLGVNGGTSEDTLRLARRALGWGPTALVVIDGSNEFMDVPAATIAPLWRFALFRRFTVLQGRADAAPGWVGTPAWGAPSVREAVHERFRRNLDTLALIAGDVGVKVVLTTQAVNLSDFDPSWSVAGDPAVLAGLDDRSDVDLEALWAANPESAEIAWVVGRRRIRDGGDAVAALHAAVDGDAMPFRSTAGIQRVVREVAASHGATVVEGQAAVAAGGVHAPADFYDWVHPTPIAAERLGEALIRGLQETRVVPTTRTGAPEDGPAAAAPGSEEQAATALRVAVTWLRWACVRQHDPAFRAQKAQEWASRAAAIHGAHQGWALALGAAARAVERGEPAAAAALGRHRDRLLAIHRCLAPRLSLPATGQG